MSVNYQQLKRFERKLAKLATADYQKFCEACAKELAARLLAKVIDRTPVIDGVLRRGWTAGKNNTSDKGNVIGVAGKSGFAQSLEIKVSNGVYEIEIINPVDYALT